MRRKVIAKQEAETVVYLMWSMKDVVRFDGFALMRGWYEASDLAFGAVFISAEGLHMNIGA